MFKVEHTGPHQLKLTGRLDAAHSERFGNLLVELPAAPDLDMADVKYVASAGISSLVKAYQHFAERDERITLRNVQPHVRTVLQYSRLDGLFDFA